MWRKEFLAYFDTDRASNGPTEAVNLLVEKIRRIGHGYRRFDHYRLRLLLHCGIEWPTLLPPRIRRRRPRARTRGSIARANMIHQQDGCSPSW